MSKSSLYIEITRRERDTILAALRLFRDYPEPLGDMLTDIATNCGGHLGLDDEEIDALCQRINT
jgi:hypothetical protein